MDAREIKLRCIEAAARAPMTHDAGYSAGVLETADKWAEWVLLADGRAVPRPVIGLPDKKK